MSEALSLRPAGEVDLADVARIQAASPEAAQWDVRDYLAHDFVVAIVNGRIAGFAVARRVAEDESELLNLAIDPMFRRSGIARHLLRTLTARFRGALWLEVRESNSGARKLYEKLGFKEMDTRRDYYRNSGERAIVMKIHS